MINKSFQDFNSCRSFELSKKITDKGWFVIGILGVSPLGADHGVMISIEVDEEQTIKILHAAIESIYRQQRNRKDAEEEYSRNA